MQFWPMVPPSTTHRGSEPRAEEPQLQIRMAEDTVSSPPPHELCDLRQVSEPLCVSFTSLIRWR